MMTKRPKGLRNLTMKVCGRTIRETAEILDCSAANVVQIQNRALHKIAVPLLQAFRPHGWTEQDLTRLAADPAFIDMVIELLKEKGNETR